MVPKDRKNRCLFHLSWYVLISLAKQQTHVVIILLVLDPSVKLAYAEDKWDDDATQDGMARLEAVVGSSLLKNSVAWLKYVTQFDEYYTPPPALVSETTVTSAIGTPHAAFHYVYY